MRHASSIKHVLLTLGFGALLAACGGEEEMMTPTAVTWANIQTDIKNNGCTTASVCHAVGATNRFVIDLTAGKEMDNYNKVKNASPALINTQAPDMSDLIVVPKTGKDKQNATHMTLSTTVIDRWTKWIAAGANFQ